MVGRTITLVGMALTLLLASACGRETEPDLVSDAGSESESESGTTVTATADAEETIGLTDLASRAVEQLGADPRTAPSGILTSDPETWWVTMSVDVPIDEADFGDPIAALPPPLDALGPAIVRLRVTADSPNGLVGAMLGRPFTGLLAELDGSTQVVTTIPGDDLPSTTTWPVSNARITQLVVPVVDFDASPLAGEIVSVVGPEHLVLGPAESIAVITVAEAEAGVPATHPPLTGTWRPPPEDSEDAPDTTGSATD